jgi:hypothetical protein
VHVLCVIRACPLRDKTMGREVFALNPPARDGERVGGAVARQTKKIEMYKEEGKERQMSLAPKEEQA